MNQDFREFLQSLNENEVRYLVVGGYAVAFHGHPRYTRDLDIWICSERDNVERLLDALRRFGFGSLDLAVDDFMQPDTVVQLGYPPNRIDLLTAVSGAEFESCYPSRVEVGVGGTMVKFIDLENLKKIKQATGRHQDLADLEHLT